MHRLPPQHVIQRFRAQVEVVKTINAEGNPNHVISLNDGNKVIMVKHGQELEAGEEPKQGRAREVRWKQARYIWAQRGGPGQVCARV